jgi:cell division protein FtsI/penicillin-binding protein 2
MTVNTARQLQDLMRNAVANGAAQNAGRPDIDIAGHASLAYSGEGTQAWFVGFATLRGRQGVAVAIVLENSDDPGLAADIGGTALMAAQTALNSSNE